MSLAGASEAGRLERQHFLACNEKAVAAASAQLGKDMVIAVLDSRDPVAREWLKVTGLPEQRVRAHEAACGGRAIPTFLIAVDRECAIDLSFVHSPHVSETIESLLPDAGRVVLGITAGGTTMVLMPHAA